MAHIAGQAPHASLPSYIRFVGSNRANRELSHRLNEGSPRLRLVERPRAKAESDQVRYRIANIVLLTCRTYEAAERGGGPRSAEILRDFQRDILSRHI
jgi:hypothetical protein